MTSQKSDTANITQTPWGVHENEDVWLFALQNSHNMQVSVSNWGASMVSIKPPDRSGKFADVILGYDSFEEYLIDDYYCGVLVGRFANRIGNGFFKIGEKPYQLSLNSGSAALNSHSHGGIEGFGKKLWKAKVEGNSVVMSHFSKDGDERYPGNLNIQLSFTLTEDNALYDLNALNKK
jgi:aldose 1-epimerase